MNHSQMLTQLFQQRKYCCVEEPRIKNRDVHFPELCVYTNIQFPYRLPVHHFHFDPAGEARMIGYIQRLGRLGQQYMSACEKKEKKIGNRRMGTSIDYNICLEWKWQLHITLCTLNILSQIEFWLRMEVELNSQ